MLRYGRSLIFPRFLKRRALYRTQKTDFEMQSISRSLGTIKKKTNGVPAVVRSIGLRLPDQPETCWPKRATPYRSTRRKELDSALNQYLAAGLVPSARLGRILGRLVVSPTTSGDVRITVHYRTRNSTRVSSLGQLPRVDQFLDPLLLGQRPRFSPCSTWFLRSAKNKR